MDKLIGFLMIISWIGAVGSTLAFFLCLYNNVTYPGSHEELLDLMQGKRASFPVGRWIIISIICWAFIFSFK